LEFQVNYKLTVANPNTADHVTNYATNFHHPKKIHASESLGKEAVVVDGSDKEHPFYPVVRVVGVIDFLSAPA
jgi:hypothetical protein